MTNKDAKRFLTAKLTCMERDVSGRNEQCNNRECDECDLCYEQGNMGEQKDALRLAIIALEQESALDKIVADIIDIADDDPEEDYKYGYNCALMMAVQIISKYKAESGCKK